MKYEELHNYNASPRKMPINCDGEAYCIPEKSGRQ